MNKKKIPDSLRELVLTEAGHQCAYCGHRDGLNLTMHHIERERDGGPTDFNNLIALCFNCHNRVDETETIPDKDIRRLKRHLVRSRLTQPGVNALKLAYENRGGVVALPFLVQHLLDDGLLEYVEYQMTVPTDTGETEVTALYKITGPGEELLEKWVL
jgi:hypothetical protein